MDDHLISFLTHVMTFVATLAGIGAGVVRSKNKAELAFAKTQIEFYQAELERTRVREATVLSREDQLRKEIADRQHELRVMHEEYNAARHSRMAKGKTADAALVVIDGLGTILDVSENIERFTGWVAAELIGKSVEILVPERYRAEHAAALRTASSSGKKIIRGENDPGSKLFVLRKEEVEKPVNISLVGGGKGLDARYTATFRDRASD